MGADIASAPQECVKSSLLGIWLEVLGRYATCFWGPGTVFRSAGTTWGPGLGGVLTGVTHGSIRVLVRVPKHWDPALS